MEAEEGEQPEEDSQQQVHLTLSHLPALTSLLQAIKIGAKQVCSIIIAPEGLWLRWEDDSKTLQSSVQLRSELFAAYDCGTQRRVFGLSLSQLVDTLAVFASVRCADLQLHYPGPDGELQLEMVDSGTSLSLSSGAKCVMYARIPTLEQEVPGDMLDYWTAPASYFLVTPGALLKEAVEDLEWPGGGVCLKLTRDPPAIALSANGTGSLEVQLNAGGLSGYSVSGPTLVAHYRYKNMRAALAHIPTGKDLGGGPVSTKVQIDANGLLKVTHIVPLSGGRAGGGHAASFAPTPSMSGLGHSQQQQTGLDSGHQAVIQFVSLPMEEEEE